MLRLIGAFVSLLAVAAVVILLLMFVATGRSPVSQLSKVLRRDDGGWVEIRGEDEDIRDFEADGTMRKHIYSDLSGIRHTVEFDSDGNVVSHIRTE